MIAWFDSNSGFIVSLGVLVGIIAATGVTHRWIQPMAKLLQAQLVPNGGGSLVDKVSRIPSIQATALANHAEAQRHWEALEAGQAGMEKSTVEWRAVADNKFDSIQGTLTTLKQGQTDARGVADTLRKETEEAAHQLRTEVFNAAQLLQSQTEAAAILKDAGAP